MNENYSERGPIGPRTPSTGDGSTNTSNNDQSHGYQSHGPSHTDSVNPDTAASSGAAVPGTAASNNTTQPTTYSQGWNQPRSDAATNNAGPHAAADHGAANTAQFPAGGYSGSNYSQPGSAQPGPGFAHSYQSSYQSQGPQAQAGQAGQAGQAYTTPQGAPAYGMAPQAAPTGSAGASGTSGAQGHKSKRQVGLVTAMAMALVAAIGAGGVTGALIGRDGQDQNLATVNEALNQPVANNGTNRVPPEGSIEDVSAKVLPAVVAIQVQNARGASEGSGSIISSDGYVLTNHHVIADSQDGRIIVTLNDGSKHEAEYVASDPNTDVGVIRIQDVQDLPVIEFGDSSQLNVGQQVVAVGSPLGLNATVTSGIVSALNRPVRASQEGGESSLIDAIQTDAAVNPGNSGGPLVDMNGRIVGMNSMIASLSAGAGGQGSGSIGLGFAIPSNFAKRVADQLINTGEVTHPMLGVQVDGRNQSGGALVVSAEEGSPAAEAGIGAGDVITRVNDRPIESSDALITAIRSQDYGATVTLQVQKGGEGDPRPVEVTLTGE